MQSCCPAGVHHESVAPNSTTGDSAFKVRLIPGIAYNLNKSYNSSVFRTTILLLLYIFV